MNSFELRYGVIVKKLPGLSDAQDMEIANAYVKEAQRAFYEDVDIWHSKTCIDNPLLREGDGPLYPMRDWYSQFYLDAADVRTCGRRASRARRSRCGSGTARRRRRCITRSGGKGRIAA